MTKNNKVECWKPKNCGKSSSKCGDCITLNLKLLDDWQTNTEDGDPFPNAIVISNFKNIEDTITPTNYNKFFSIAYIPQSAKTGYAFSVDICKSNIKNNTLYYVIGDKYFEVRGPIGIPFAVDTSKCVNLIPIDNFCPKSICKTTTITFSLNDAPSENTYVISGEASYDIPAEDECDYDTENEEFDDEVLTLNKVVSPSTIKVKLYLNNGFSQKPYKYNPYPIGLSGVCNQTIQLQFDDFEK